MNALAGDDDFHEPMRAILRLIIGRIVQLLGGEL